MLRHSTESCIAATLADRMARNIWVRVKCSYIADLGPGSERHSAVFSRPYYIPKLGDITHVDKKGHLMFANKITHTCWWEADSALEAHTYMYLRITGSGNTNGLMQCNNGEITA